jgi:hypothetical protein
MGCTASTTKVEAAQANPPNTVEKTADETKKDDRKSEDLQTLSRNGMPNEQSGKLSIATPIRENSSHISIVPDEDQDLFVPPLTPRKTKGIELWIEGVVLPTGEDDALRAYNSRRNSDVDSIRTDATGATQGTVMEGQERKPEIPGSNLTHENIRTHMSILAQKEGSKRKLANHSTSPLPSMNAEYVNSGILSTEHRVIAEPHEHVSRADASP